MTYPDIVAIPTDPAVREVGRYVLQDLTAEHAGTALWLAFDPALQRTVGVRLIPLDDPRTPALRQAAADAAKVYDRRLVRVLDVVETDTSLGIVTEWVDGYNWLELLDENWSLQEATVVALEVSRALSSAHAAGVAHGRIRPSSVMITDTREVRLRALGVDAALHPADPFDDPFRADIHGVGALLYAGLTRHWPGPGSSRGLPPAPLVHGKTSPPSSVVPGIPSELDRVVARSLRTVARSRKQPHFSDISECTYSLEAAAVKIGARSDETRQSDDTDNVTNRLLGRVGTTVVALLAAVGLLLLLWQLTLGGNNNDVLASTSDAAETPVVEDPEWAEEGPFPILAATDFDPEGNGSENPELVELAYDGDKSTAWVTEPYFVSEPAGASGVGIVFDLGSVRPVRAIDLKLTGSGADFVVATSKRKNKAKPEKYTGVVAITGSGEKIRVRTPQAVDARFVLIKLTRLPFDGETYSSGLREVRILG